MRMCALHVTFYVLSMYIVYHCMFLHNSFAQWVVVLAQWLCAIECSFVFVVPTLPSVYTLCCVVYTLSMCCVV